MRKATVLLLVLSLFLLSGCCLRHDWQEATCAAPRTCASCQKTEGESLAHSWQEATCTAPRTCPGCGLTEGEALGHDPDGPQERLDIVSAAISVSSSCKRCGEALDTTATELDSFVQEERFIFTPGAFMERMAELARNGTGQYPDFQYQFVDQGGNLCAVVSWGEAPASGYLVYFFYRDKTPVAYEGGEEAGDVWCVVLGASLLADGAEQVDVLIEEEMLKILCLACDPAVMDGFAYDLIHMAKLESRYQAIENGQITGYEEQNGLLYEFWHQYASEGEAASITAIEQVLVYASSYL